MKDVKKTSVERENSSKRMRRRKRNMHLYVFVVFVIVICIGLTVSYTFLFNINEIKVSGEASEYTAEEIATASGIKMGDNLLRIKCDEAEKRILNELLYIETAEVDRKFPFSLEITVTKCIPGFNVSYEMGTLLVSQQGKVLENNGYITEGLPVFIGYAPVTTTAGQKLKSEEEQKHRVYEEFVKIILANPDNKIVSVDMTDKHEIVVTYSNEIVFKMGNWNDIPYKLSLADTVMEKVGNEKGYISMIGSNQCSFRKTEDTGFESVISPEPINPTESNENNQDDDDENNQITPEPDNNETVTTTYVDEEEEMFREHDEMNITTTTTATTEPAVD